MPPRPPSPSDSSSPSAAAIAARLRAAGCVFAEEEAALLIEAAAGPAELDAMVERRAAGHPLEQVVGWAEFCGLRIQVEPGVFVPRRRSEFLVSQAVAIAVGAGPRIVLVELCCGTAAVGISVARALARADRHVDLYAVDVDQVAVRCARANLAALGWLAGSDKKNASAAVRGHVYQGDVDAPLPAGLRGQVDVLVANAPYVPSAAIALLPAEARLHEPRSALDGGADGVDVQRRVAAAAPRWLAPGGHLLIETSDRQAGLTAAAVEAAGLRPTVIGSAELEATVVIGSRSA